MKNSAPTVLIVDDNPTNLSLLYDTLKQANYKPLVAESGTQALRQIAKLMPDIILLDVDMPGPDGFETCRQLKMEPDTADIPVIFLTALGETTDKVRGFDVGGVDYLTKPVDPPEVLARLNTHLTIRNLRRQVEARNQQLSDEAWTASANLRIETERRLLYQQERFALLQNVSQQSEALQQLASQVMADQQQQGHLLGQTLQVDVVAQLDLLHETLSDLHRGLAGEPPEAEHPLLPQLTTGLELLAEARQNLARVTAGLSPAATADQSASQSPFSTLSEREVAKLVAQSKGNQEIATLLGISAKTVGVYRWRMMQKLNVENVPALVKLAIKHRFVDLT